MDLQDMNSLELEEKIRKYNKILPLVPLTSPGKHVPPNHAYLTKPIKPAQLHKVLTEILPGQIYCPDNHYPDKYCLDNHCQVNQMRAWSRHLEMISPFKISP
jgi:two-component SAPR family response regulator